MVQRSHILWASLVVYLAATLFAGRMHNHAHGLCASGACSSGICPVDTRDGGAAIAARSAQQDRGRSGCGCSHHHPLNKVSAETIAAADGAAPQEAESRDAAPQEAAPDRTVPPGETASLFQPAGPAGSADGCLACQFLGMAAAMAEQIRLADSVPLVARWIGPVCQGQAVASIRGFSSRAPPEIAVL